MAAFQVEDFALDGGRLSKDFCLRTNVRAESSEGWIQSQIRHTCLQFVFHPCRRRSMNTMQNFKELRLRSINGRVCREPRSREASWWQSGLNVNLNALVFSGSSVCTLVKSHVTNIKKHACFCFCVLRV